VDGLSALLEFSAGRKRELGIEHTPREIAQQPKTWQSTLALYKRLQPELQAFLRKHAGRPLLLVGAGTSDFVGRSVERLLERCWQTPVRARSC
jgi:tagatose-6-phosphate ketose/aldose isomerase